MSDRALASVLWLIVYLHVAMVITLNFNDGTGKIIALVLAIITFLSYKKTTKRVNRKRERTFDLLVVAMLLITMTGINGVNQKMNQYFMVENPSFEDKGRLVLSKLTQIPAHKEIKEEKIGNVRYFYEEENRDDVTKIDDILKNISEEWDLLLGEGESTVGIRFKNSIYIKEDAGLKKEVRAYYNPINQTITLNTKDDDLKYVLIHEYSHFRIHEYATGGKGTLKHIPQWFNEGLSDVAANGLLTNYKRLPKLKIKTEPYLLHSNESFHNENKKGNEVYLQSYVMVGSMINDYGYEKIIPLLKSKKEKDFYKAFKELTGMTPEKYIEKL